ncbi:MULTISPECIES: DNA-binding domain-containing protein [Enterobacter]|uniref:HvfC/BufC N-terminal domain-containing protein n=1 Tax=Enterobacter TaxID=547 RepID=UPI001CBBEC38|nr:MULTISPECIES: DNA-binding domain-containing protein [Enterobacter]UAN18814.1 putative DNA-binding domain-containing protein [Enterobacter asburiae]UAN24739.1 putative DNA-binding domain-containing protein [Enterobacter sp. JBIWA003]UAN34157.1 putative DNA-binding domain-containing protein [Enterobacter sp. JBIWA005]
MQRAFINALLDPDADPPAGLKIWNGSDPALRFSVYRNNVMASLVDALAANFPVLQEQVGSEFFRAMAATFIRQHPPSSSVLARYGENLPAWIAAFEPLADWPWLGDLAKLEFSVIDSLNALDNEKELTALIPAFDPQNNGLMLEPSLRVITSPYAIFQIWCAHQEALPETIDPYQAENVLLFRQQNAVRILPVNAAQAHFVNNLRLGKSLIASLEASEGLDHELDVGQTLLTLRQHGLIITIRENIC